MRNPGWAAVLSFIFNGLGQLYNGQIIKGLVIIFISIINLLMVIFGSILIGFWLLGRIPAGRELFLGTGLFCVGLVFIAVLGIYSIVDAYKVASKK
jgi:TM2 domain-containing membrane protein YozV